MGWTNYNPRAVCMLSLIYVRLGSHDALCLSGVLIPENEVPGYAIHRPALLPYVGL